MALLELELTHRNNEAPKAPPEAMARPVRITLLFIELDIARSMKLISSFGVFFKNELLCRIFNLNSVDLYELDRSGLKRTVMKII